MNILARRLATLSVLLVVAGCSADRAPTAVPSRSAAAPRSGDLLGGLGQVVGGTLDGVTGLLRTVHGVTRNTPLAQPITVTQVIGSAGGTLSIPEAGVSVWIPRGALRQETEIVMTARAGSLLAYDFAPHGIVFARPLVFTQDLHGTSASPLDMLHLKLAYYEDPSLLGAATGVVSQLLGGVVNLLSWSFIAPIPHFSGYMVACDWAD